MAMYSFFGKSVDLPAALGASRAKTRDPGAWLYGQYVTVRLLASIRALRVHTEHREFPGRLASGESGAWILIGDVIQTSSELASSRALPAVDPTSMVAFTHTSEAHLLPGTMLNIGLAAQKFGGAGGGFQAEHVFGPAIRFTPLTGKHWHSRAGHA